MLESIELINFQPHRRRTIEFDPRVTVIIGDTDKGKSSILRAIRWWALNQFDGPADSFIRWGKKTAKAIGHIDGHEIVREKGTHNAYDLDGQELKSFGAGKVPETVERVLRLTEDNFQSQLDLHFWFNESPARVSRDLNRIVNLGSIDDALTRVASQVRQARSVVDVSTDRLNAALKVRDSLAWTIDADKDLQRLERLQARIDANKLRIDRLQTLITRGTRAKEVINSASSLLETATVTKSYADHSRLFSEKIERLETLIDRLRNARKLSRREIPTPPDNLFKKLTDAKARQAKLFAIIVTIERKKDAICLLEKKIDDLGKRLPSRCPICLTPLAK